MWFDGEARYARSQRSKTFTARALGGSLLLHVLVVLVMAAGFTEKSPLANKENAYPPLRVTLMVGPGPVALPTSAEVKETAQQKKKRQDLVPKLEETVRAAQKERPKRALPSPVDLAPKEKKPAHTDTSAALTPLIKSPRMPELALTPLSSPRASELEAVARAAERPAKVGHVTKTDNPVHEASPPPPPKEKGKEKGKWHVDPLAVYQQDIAERVQRYMRGAKTSAVCRLRVHLARDGGVREQHVLSGDDVACQEAQRALLRSGRLPLPSDPALYQHLSTLVLTIRTAS